MDHPLRSDDCLSLRRGLYDLLRAGFSIPRQSNIVFVCGGNDGQHMRCHFEKVFPNLLPGFEFFKPEFAMHKYKTLDDSEPFDITIFEELIGDLSHSIVIFPEAPGSIAETGYFSALPHLAKKILLVHNSVNVETDSFISIGPAKKIADASRFQPNIQFDYANPEFKLISQRLIDRAPLHLTRRSLDIRAFGDMDSFELFALIQSLVFLLGIATVEDIEFFLNGLFSAKISSSKTKQIVSILVGSKRLVDTGDYGHLQASETGNRLLQLKEGAKINFNVWKLDAASIYLSADNDFQRLLGALNAH